MPEHSCRSFCTASPSCKITDMYFMLCVHISSIMLPMLTWTLFTHPTGRDHRGEPFAELVCLRGGTRAWTDRVHGQVQAMAGSRCYSAVALRTGELLIYTPAGRRSVPPLQLRALPVMLVASGDWRLMVLTLEGQLQVYNIQQVGGRISGRLGLPSCMPASCLRLCHR